MAIFSRGKRTGIPDHSMSAQATRPFAGNKVVMVSNGVSGAGIGAHWADPVWRHTTVSVSWQAAKKGSHTPLCRLGIPHWAGNSGKLTALKPRAALRRSSSVASCGSASHGSCSGMMRSGKLPAHTSRCESFQARSTASPNSGSSLFQNTVPANPAISDGKFSDAQIPARSMSAIRALMSDHPGEAEVRVVAVLVTPYLPAVVGLDDPWRPAGQRGGQPAVEHVGWLDDVVVDGDQHVLPLAGAG